MPVADPQQPVAGRVGGRGVDRSTGVLFVRVEGLAAERRGDRFTTRGDGGDPGGLNGGVGVRLPVDEVPHRRQPQLRDAPRVLGAADAHRVVKVEHADARARQHAHRAAAHPGAQRQLQMLAAGVAKADVVAGEFREEGARHGEHVAAQRRRFPRRVISDRRRRR